MISPVTVGACPACGRITTVRMCSHCADPAAESALIAALRALAPESRARVIAAAQAPEGGAVEAVRAAVRDLERQADGIVLMAPLRAAVPHLQPEEVEGALLALERSRLLELSTCNDPKSHTAAGGWRIPGRGLIAYVITRGPRAPGGV